MTGRRRQAALVVSVLTLVLSTTGLADAARHAVLDSVDGHRVSQQPYANGILVLGKDDRFPASAIPEPSLVKETQLLAGKKLAQLELSCPEDDVNIGTWCLESAPYPLSATDLGQNDFEFATKACEQQGGWLPDASELLGAAERVRLESTIHDNKLTATVDEDPERGLKDQREMSSDLVTTQAGSSAAGVEGSVPVPETLQYVTVYSNGTKGGFAGSEPVSQPENFRCAYHKTIGALLQEEE